MTQGVNFHFWEGVDWSQGQSCPSGWHLVSGMWGQPVPLCDLSMLSASLLDWNDLSPDSFVLEVQLTGITSALCNLTTFDLTPFLDLKLFTA